MRRVLIVEDDSFVYDAIKAAFLLKGGFEVAYAGDGEAALAVLEREPPDLAIIDFWLPEMSGITIARQAAARNVPVILMSGYPDVIASPEKYEFPMLPKPFRVSELVEGIDQVIAEASRRLPINQQPVRPAGQWPSICGRMTLGTLATKA